MRDAGRMWFLVFLVLGLCGFALSPHLHPQPSLPLLRALPHPLPQPDPLTSQMSVEARDSFTALATSV